MGEQVDRLLGTALSSGVRGDAQERLFLLFRARRLPFALVRAGALGTVELVLIVGQLGLDVFGPMAFFALDVGPSAALLILALHPDTLVLLVRVALVSVDQLAEMADPLFFNRSCALFAVQADLVFVLCFYQVYFFATLPDIARRVRALATVF